MIVQRNKLSGPSLLLMVETSQRYSFHWVLTTRPGGFHCNVLLTASLVHRLLFNDNQLMGMHFSQKGLIKCLLYLHLSSYEIGCAVQHKYLVTVIDSRYSNSPVKQQIKYLYANSNMPLQKFTKCSASIKSMSSKWYVIHSLHFDILNQEHLFD